jgi:hypothetical protein
LRYDLDPDATVGDLKQSITDRQTFHAFKQTLIFKGRRMEAGSLVKDNGVHDGCTVFLGFKERSKDAAKRMRRAERERARRAQDNSGPAPSLAEMVEIYDQLQAPLVLAVEQSQACNQEYDDDRGIHDEAVYVRQCRAADEANDHRAAQNPDTHAFLDIEASDSDDDAEQEASQHLSDSGEMWSLSGGEGY